MAARGGASGQPPRVPMRPRRRRRWAAVAALAGAWAALMIATGSGFAGSVLFLLLCSAGLGVWVAARCLGIRRDHPWLRRLAARPWRDGRDVLQLGLRHLPDVFIVTPSGSLVAPNMVELRMHPGDLAALTEAMDLALVNSAATEVYQEQVMGRAMALVEAGPASVRVIGDPDVPVGRYRIRPVRLLGPAGPPGGPARAKADAVGSGHAVGTDPSGDDEHRITQADLGALTISASSTTVAEPAQVPLLRLVSNGSIAETRVSGARAGRGSAVELGLPAVPTVSRVHATFAFAGGHWRITGLGRNGVLLNGEPLAGEQVIRDGDSINWGRQSDALVSRIEIGWSRALPSRAPA